MSQYLPNFIRNAKGKFNPDLGFISVKSGTEAYLLEDELNEIQWIQGEARAELIRHIAKSGCVDIPKTNDPTLPGGLVELHESCLNGILINGFDAILNGYMAHINSDDKSGFIIQLSEPPIVGTRYDFVYLEFWLKELKQYDSVPRFGGFDNGSIPYDIIDPRMNIETSQRVQLQWAIRTADNIPYPDIVNRDFTNIVINPQGPNGIQNSNYKFVKSSGDQFLLCAGNGDETSTTQFGTLDGHIYAIPLFVVRRINKSGYNPQYNVDGGVDYVNAQTVSGRPDNKFANMIYVDQVIDMRHRSALGEEQLDAIYVRYTDFDEYQSFVKISVESPLQMVIADLEVFHADFRTETARLDVKIDNIDTDIRAQHKTDIDLLTAKIENLDLTLNGSLTASVNSLNERINSVNTSLTAYIDNQVKIVEDLMTTMRYELTKIIDEDIVEINATLTDLHDQINNTINIEIANVNTKLANVNTQLTLLQGQLNTTNTTIVEVKGELQQEIEECMENCNTALLDTKNTIVQQHNTDVAALNKRIDDLNTGLTININGNQTTMNTKVDSINAVLTSSANKANADIITTNKRIDDLVLQLNTYNVTMSGYGTRIAALESDVRIMKIQLATLFQDGNASDFVLYGLDMNRKMPTTVGGTVTTDAATGTVTNVASSGTLIGVTFTNKKDYSLIVTPQRPTDGSIKDGSIGDIWIERADTSFTFKNTGLPGIVCDVFAVKNDVNPTITDKYVWSNAYNTVYPDVTFSGTAGTRINLPMRAATDFVYITPAQNYKGEVGEIYITVDDNGFTVYNTGQAGNKFEWTVIDTTLYGSGGRLRNILVYDINLPGNDAYFNQAGQYGGDFYSVMVSTPMTTTAAGHQIVTPGTIGDISVTKSAGYFTLYNTGLAVGTVRCVVFKQVDPQIATP